MQSEKSLTLKSASKMFNILEYVIEQDGVRVIEVADALSLNKSTVHVHLQTLVQQGYVLHVEDHYQPSLRFLHLGEQIRKNLDIYRKGADDVDELASETGELANLGIMEDGNVVLVHLCEGENAIHDHLPGKRMNMHCSAMGKSILAHLPQERVEGIIERYELPQLTENTITDEEVLFNNLKQIREQGYAIDNEEGGLGIRCIAAPILQGGEPKGAISVTGPAKRIGGEYEDVLRQSVMNTANVIEVKLTYS